MGVANSKRLLELAAKGKEEEAIALLNDTYLIDPNYTNSDGDTALHLSCSNNLIELTSKLLSFGVSINIKNKFESCPLHIATRMGHDQIVRLLLKGKSCDVNIESCSSINALTIASSCNNLSIARLLLENNAHIQDTTLFFASLHSNGDEMCRILLNHGANVNATDEYGNTALMQASALCHEKVVNVLVSREWTPIIQINKQNQYGWSALHFAYSSSSKLKTKQIAKANIINILLKKGANMQLNNNDGEKPKDVSPQKFDIDDIDDIDNIENKPPRKKRKLSPNNLSQQFEIIGNDKEELQEEDPMNNYSPPKARKNNRKRNNTRKRRK